MPLVLFNQVFVLLPVMLLVAHYDFAFTGKTVPVWMFLVHAQLLGAVHDGVFYFAHRLLHINWVYKHLHYVHHSSTGGVAASSLYMHPIDFIGEIILPYGVFLCLVTTDWRFDCLLACLGSLFAMYEHSGYCFTTIHAFDSRMHLSHHAGRLNGSFAEGVGSPGIFDLAFGTELKADAPFNRRAEVILHAANVK